MAANNFDFPSNSQVVIPTRFLTAPWAQWFTRIQTICASLQQSGETTSRPTKALWVGRRYFDTDLGIPVWVQSVTAGVAVWVDATGAPV